MISSINIQGFKSFKSLDDFPLRSLNVLIGPNRSGKTNFLDFWDFLSEACKQGLSHAVAQRGGIGKVLSWNGVERMSFRCGIDIESEVRDSSFIRKEGDYLVGITKNSPSGSIDNEEYSIVTEKLVGALFVDKSGLEHTPIPDPDDRDLRDPHGVKAYQASSSNLVITQIRDAIQDPVLNRLRNVLANIAVHSSFDSSPNLPMRSAQAISDAPVTRLNRNGDNLSSVLHHLHNQSQYRDFYDALLLTLRRAFPSFEEIAFPTNLGKGKTILAWKDKNFPKRAITANLLSDGTIHFLCILVALYDPEPPTLLCLDSPEVGLHPQLLRLLAGVLQEASERMQIIISTHSSDLISFLENADDVVVVESDEGWSTLKRLSHKELEHWLKEYSLGELWKSGEIGGRSETNLNETPLDKIKERKEEIRRRRREFKVEAFDLGGEVTIDREELYSERGL